MKRPLSDLRPVGPIIDTSDFSQGGDLPNLVLALAYKVEDPQRVVDILDGIEIEISKSIDNLSGDEIDFRAEDVEVIVGLEEDDSEVPDEDVQIFIETNTSEIERDEVEEIKREVEDVLMDAEAGSVEFIDDDAFLGM